MREVPDARPGADLARFVNKGRRMDLCTGKGCRWRRRGGRLACGALLERIAGASQHAQHAQPFLAVGPRSRAGRDAFEEMPAFEFEWLAFLERDVGGLSAH